MGGLFAMRWFLVIVALGLGRLAAQTETNLNFWEPRLPDGQAFVTLMRSVKSYRLTHYDLLYQKQRYPVTELNVELTHGVVRFFHVGAAAGQKVPLSLREIADGKFGENHALERQLPSRPPSSELKTRGPEAHDHPLFFLNSPEEVHNLHENLDYRFKVGFPW